MDPYLLEAPIDVLRASLVAQMIKSLPAMQETQVQSLGQEDPLEKEMATHSSIHPWKIPWKCCRKWGGLPTGPQERALVLPLRKELSEETRADKARDFTGEWRPGGEREVREPGELLCRVARSLGVYGDGIGFRVALASHSNSESFLVAHTLLSQDGC